MAAGSSNGKVQIPLYELKGLVISLQQAFREQTIPEFKADIADALRSTKARVRLAERRCGMRGAREWTD